VGVEIWRFVAAIYYQTESEVVLCGVVRLVRPRDTTQNLNASDWARDKAEVRRKLLQKVENFP
jgi:hypothetical protein